MQFKAKINPFNGQLQLVPTNIVLVFKSGVDEQVDLPLTGNSIGDARIANDTGHLYVWSIESSSGLLTDWVDAGDIVDLNWSAISGKPSSAVADIDDAVNNRHAPNTDTYLATMVTNTLYVDNKRTDDYTPTGTITKPFKTIQSAHDAITGNSSTNKFEIKVARGAKYTETFAYSKDYVMLSSVGLGATLSGAITITSPHPTFVDFDIQSAVTLSLTSHFSINVINCRVTTGIWNITATTPTGDEYLQVLGNDMWTSRLNATGITGVIGWSGGIIFSGTFNLTNCYFQASGTDIEGMTINLETGTDAYLGAILAGGLTVNLKTGAKLHADADALGNITVVNTGGTLYKTTKASNINNDSSVVGDTVKDALETLVGTSHAPTSDNQTADTVPTEDSGISVQDALNNLNVEKTDIISVNTTYTVKASGGDFTTIQSALDSLKNKWINPDVTVTISVDSGLFTHTSTIMFRHPHGNRINIVGASPVITAVTSFASQSGTAGNYSVTLNVTSSAGMTIGDYCIIASSTGTGEHRAIMGCWEITNVPSITQITVKNTYRKASFPTLTVTGGSVKCLKTILKFNGCDGIMPTGATGFIYNLAIVGNGTSNDGINISQRGSNFGTHVVYLGTPSGDYKLGINGFGRYGIAQTSSADLCVWNIAVSNCGSYGVYAYSQSKIAGTGIISSGNGSIGVYATDGAFITAVSSFAIGNATVGFYAFNRAGINAEGSEAVGNIYSGFQCLGTSYIYAKTSKALNNGYHGYSSSYNGMIYAQSSVSTGNGASVNYYGYWSSNGGHIRADSTTASGNFSGDYFAEHFSFIKVTGYVGSPTFSPTVDTMGNGGSIIRSVVATPIKISEAITNIPAGNISSTNVQDAINELDTEKPQISSGIIAPTFTPTRVGNIYVDTVAKKLYFAVGIASSADWIIAN
jgi:hypothetical protein